MNRAAYMKTEDANLASSVNFRIIQLERPYLVEHRQQRHDDYGHDTGDGDGQAAHSAGYVADGDDSGGAHCVAGRAGCQTPGDVGFDPQQFTQCGGDDGSQDTGADDCDNRAAYDAAHFPGNTGGDWSGY